MKPNMLQLSIFKNVFRVAILNGLGFSFNLVTSKMI